MSRRRTDESFACRVNQLTLQLGCRCEEILGVYGGLLMAESYQFPWLPSCWRQLDLA